MRTPYATLILALMAAGPVAAEAPQEPTRIDVAPRLDGRLLEPEWQRALLVQDFRQRSPREGAPPSERTEVRLMYTATDLYVGLRAYDSRPDAIRGTVLRRDNFDLLQNDQFVVAIDSYGRGRDGYWFSTNPLGVRVDTQFFEEGNVWQKDWNGVWDCAAARDGQGWTAELRIPFSTLRLTAAPANVMGINLFRRIVRTSEQLFAPLIPLAYENGTPNVSIARQYLFTGLKPRRDVRLRPYVKLRAGEGAAAEAGDAFEAGLDVTYGLTPSVVATVTVNTDFALTEVDDRQVNLTRYSLFYPEKRDFFLENGGLFQLGLPQEVELFFSRRVGLRQDGPVAEERPIPLGAKLTGRAGPVELGLLEVRTSALAGSPAQNVLVGRARYGFGRSSVGVLATHLVDDGQTATAGADGTIYVYRDIAISGFAALTEVDDGRWPMAYNLTLFRAGEQAAFRVAVTDVDERFDPELGFVLRPGTRRWSGRVQLPWYFDAGGTRRVVPAYAASHVDGARGLESWSHQVSLGLDRASEDAALLYGSLGREVTYVPFSIFRGVTVPPGSYEAGVVGLKLTAKPARPLTGEATFEHRQFFGGRARALDARLAWTPSRHVSASGIVSATWVDLPSSRFRADVLQARLDGSADTRWSGRLLVQWDNASRDLGLNARLGFLLREGTEAAVVYGRRDPRGDRDHTMPGPGDRVLLAKLTWLFQP
jgi:hypothetical protein